MAEMFKNLVNAELSELSDVELALRTREHLRQNLEYWRSPLAQKIVKEALAAIKVEAQHRGLLPA